MAISTSAAAVKLVTYANKLLTRAVSCRATETRLLLTDTAQEITALAGELDESLKPSVPEPESAPASDG